MKNIICNEFDNLQKGLKEDSLYCEKCYTSIKFVVEHSLKLKNKTYFFGFDKENLPREI